MKKMFIIAVIFIGAGALFCGAAYAAGSRYVDSNLTDVSAAFTTNDISKIEINEHVAEIKFLKTNDSEIRVQAENIIESEFECFVNSSKLEISYNPNTVRFGFISLPRAFITYKTPVITVYIPEGKFFDEVHFGGGVGRTYVEEIITDSLVISGGVGEYDIKNIIAGSLRLDSGVGSVKINGTVNGGSRIECGVGEVRISGELNGDIKLKTGVGSVRLDLSGNPDDYNIKTDSGVGTIKLNGSKMPGSVNNGGKYNLDIDAGVGSINVNIK